MFSLTFLHILGSAKYVGDDMDELKDIAKNAKVTVDEGLNKIQGKKISLTFWFEEIDLVNFEEKFDDIGDETERNIYLFTDSFVAQLNKKLAISLIFIFQILIG